MKGYVSKLQECAEAIERRQGELSFKRDKLCGDIQARLKYLPDQPSGARLAAIRVKESGPGSIRFVLTGDLWDPETEIDTPAIELYTGLCGNRDPRFLQQHLVPAVVEFVLRTQARLDRLETEWRCADKIRRNLKAAMSACEQLEYRIGEIHDGLACDLSDRGLDGSWPKLEMGDEPECFGKEIPLPNS